MNTHHRLKLLALALMTIDHLGAYLYPDIVWFRAIGRLSAPIWFFLIGHALHYPIQRRLLLWAIAMVVIDVGVEGKWFALNALVTIAVLQYFLQRVEAHRWLQRDPAALLVAMVLLVLPSSYFLQYGTLALLFGLVGYAHRSGQSASPRGIAVGVVACVSYVVLQWVRFDFTPLQLACVVLGVLSLTWYFMHFVHRPVQWGRRFRWLEAPAVWLARHTMEYYVLHRAALAGLAWVLGDVPLLLQ